MLLRRYGDTSSSKSGQGVLELSWLIQIPGGDSASECKHELGRENGSFRHLQVGLLS